MPAASSCEIFAAERAATDRRLTGAMAAAQNGDRVAYELVLRECVPIVRRVAQAQGDRVDVLDDVVQDVLITLHGARATFDPGRSFVAWLTAITQRRTIDMLRKQGRRGAREVHAPLAIETQAAEGDPEAGALASSEARQLWTAVATLPEGQREAVETLALAENSLEDASKSTGRTKAALVPAVAFILVRDDRRGASDHLAKGREPSRRGTEPGQLVARAGIWPLADGEIDRSRPNIRTFSATATACRTVSDASAGRPEGIDVGQRFSAPRIYVMA